MPQPTSWRITLAFCAHFASSCRLSFALGVTGLLDWAKTGDVATLNTLAVDELVIQSYQGRHTVDNYQAYLPALARLRIPFKLGWVEAANGIARPRRSYSAPPGIAGRWSLCSIRRAVRPSPCDGSSRKDYR
ncbi:Protein of uncharacterised function (DUF3142) [Leclercia adecarboxylata]|uniref:Protein of uncharacterized function (DUF3142) n=1 Tax=Leclercia adecarboxylata TaxID=83655 RepID=A0A4V6JHZ3_9ENTR|nr:Protein of uncharacterised function (DUF3142) [Leclercia adecarboxylata]